MSLRLSVPHDRLLPALLVALAMALLLAALAAVGQRTSPTLIFAPGSIAFSRGAVVYVADPDGGNAIEIAGAEPGEDVESHHQIRSGSPAHRVHVDRCDRYPPRHLVAGRTHGGLAVRAQQPRCVTNAPVQLGPERGPARDLHA